MVSDDISNRPGHCEHRELLDLRTFVILVVAGGLAVLVAVRPSVGLPLAVFVMATTFLAWLVRR
jgi:hypothetical protein